MRHNSDAHSHPHTPAKLFEIVTMYYHVSNMDCFVKLKCFIVSTIVIPSLAWHLFTNIKRYVSLGCLPPAMSYFCVPHIDVSVMILSCCYVPLVCMSHAVWQVQCVTLVFINNLTHKKTVTTPQEGRRFTNK